MHQLKAHFLKSFVAGIVALLPLVSVVATVVYLENQVASGWLKNQGFYFFGLGLLLATLLIYLIGLMVTTFIGRWLWHRVDIAVDRLPILGSLYLTVKQLLGYGKGPKGIFHRVVLVPNRDGDDRFVLGLVTSEPSLESQGKLVVFLPAAPSVASGQLVFIDPARVQPSSLSASQAMQLLVSLGTVQAEDPALAD